MANETTLTIIGALVGNPELRYTASATPVANFTVASNPRIFNRDTGEWCDAEPIFIRCIVWRDPAENMAECLSKGNRVIVHGRLQQRNYETQSGDRRTVYELLVDEIGVSLRYVTTEITQTTRDNVRKPVTVEADTEESV